MTCDFTASFTIDSADWKLVVKHANGNYVTVGHIDGHKHLPAANHTNFDYVTLRCFDHHKCKD